MSSSTTRPTRGGSKANSELREYERKRDFARTEEPRGVVPKRRGPREPLRFVVQQHAARRLHYDLRLELDGVLKSWAVPKGPSLEPTAKRMAVETEDHPLAYADFEGVIPKGEYGGGTVAVWDRGTWASIGDPQVGLEKGHLEFDLRGEKLGGRWNLVRMRTRPSDRGKKVWLLIKAKDAARQRSAVEPVPTWIAPQLATLVDAPPAGAGWLHEIKLDGYRILARIRRGEVRLFSRAGKDWTDRMLGVAAALSALKLESSFLDGEVVALDADGHSRFQLLQHALKRTNPNLHYFMFDLLHLDGSDLRAAPLVLRKQLLRELLARGRSLEPLHFSAHIEGDGVAFLAEACKVRAEGMISKLAAAPYHSGRSRSWLKIKCGRRQEFAIVGFTDPRGSRVGFGALLLGVRDDAGALHYCGKVGTGFSDVALTQLRKRLAVLERKTPTVVDPSRAESHVHWVKPEWVADVAFAEWTRDGVIRHPSFVGLRAAKAAAASAPPRERTEVAGIRLSNPGRVYFPDLGVTKSELAQYYEAMAERVVPALANRPLSLVRCPDGCDKPCFYQKHVSQSISARVGRVSIEKGEEPYATVKDLAGIVSLVQIGTVEFHVWGARADRIERPDQLVFDLDPGPSVAWRSLADTARVLRGLLADLGLETFVRTTGGKGMHVVVPIERRSSWPEVNGFTHAVALQLVRQAPEQFTTRFAKLERHGKILLDCMRNQRDATAIGSYSVRARPGAPVAMPIAWDELEGATGPPVWSIREAPARLALPDPWRAFEASRRVLSVKALSAVRSA